MCELTPDSTIDLSSGCGRAEPCGFAATGPDEGAELRILHLEGDPLDAVLAADTLAADHLRCVIERVDCREDFESALVTRSFDIILADYRLNGFDGLAAQGMARRICPETPFLFLSADLGGELVAERLREGATDFVAKDHLARLPMAVRRAHREFSLREAHRRTEAQAERLARALSAQGERAGNPPDGQPGVGVRRQQHLLQSILDYSPLAIHVHDLEGRYLMANREGARMLDIDAGDIVGKPVHDLMPSRLADVVIAHHRQVLRDNDAQQFEESVVQDDRVRVLSATRFPLYDSNQRAFGTCSVSQDITTRKRIEEEVQLARLEALRANRAKSRFLSQMSHELRTPLNAILGFAQLFQPDRLDPEQAENVRQILSGGRLLLELINEVLDITRVETGRLTLFPEALDVVDAVHSAVDLVRPLATKHAVAVAIGSPPRVLTSILADRQRLGQILLNLLSNAVKYNRPGGRATIGFAEQPGGRFRILVTDSGAGIPPSKLKLLFQPFERLGAEQTDVEGTGLGLALSRVLSEAMQGAVGVESAVGRGSTFWVELPLANPVRDDASRPATWTTAAAPAGYGTIVYVEDNSSNVRLMERVLARRPGVTLLHAADARGGLELVRERHPNLVLLDWHLPDMSGDEMLRRLSDEELRQIPVVVLTADATPGLPRRLLTGRASAFLNKPIDVQQVLHVFDDFLSGDREALCHG